MINEMMDKVSKTTKKVTYEVQDVMDASKLKAKIKREEYNIDCAYQKLGKIFYENHIEEDSQNELYADVLNEIESYHAEIKKMEAQIQKMKGKRVCTNCGVELEPNMKFCYQCGAEQEIIPETDVFVP